MYPANLAYHRANSVAEAVALLAEIEDSKLLAGGHSLIPLLKLRLASPAALIDISRIEGIRGITRENDSVRIGALTTHSELASSADLRAACPLVSEAAALVGDPAVRNRGTIGGNLAHADPGSDLPTVAVALGAAIEATGPNGSRSIAAGDFFEELMSTALDDGEVMTAVRVPAIQQGQGTAYAKMLHPASRYAVVGAAAVLTVAGGRCTAASVAVGGVESTPVKASSVEAALIGSALDSDSIAQAAKAVAADLTGNAIEDVFATGSYRKAMAEVYLRRALTAAAQRAA
jgi:carbon-monoxide dehydrogenase medium subunit